MIDDEPLEEFYGDDGPDLDGPDLGAESKGATGAAGPPAQAGGRKHKAVAGALMAGIAMGLREVFEPTYHDRTAVEQPAPEQPLEPQKYEIHLDPVAPESSFAIYRPWVDEGGGDPPADVEAAPGKARPKPAGGAGALGG